MKKKKSYLKSFVWTGIVLAGAFFVLPAIFPEDAAVIDKQLSSEASLQDGDAAALPVVFSDNPLSKFFKKLSKFYGLGKKTPSGTQGVNFSADRKVFPLSAPAEDSPSVSFGEDGGSKSGAPMIFTAADGTQVTPDENGYFYGQEYYQNGQYPSEALKKSIESAVARYHKVAAAEQGMQPVYVQNPDGSLKVHYVSADDYAKYMSGATMGSDGNPQSSFFASSNRYSGAKIASKESGAFSSGSSSGNSFSKGGALSAEDGSMNGTFATLNAKLNQNKKDTAKEAEEQQKKEKEDFEKKKLELLSSSDKFRSTMYVEPSSSKRQIPTYNKDMFGGKPMILDRMFLNGFLKNFGVGTEDIKNKNLKTAYLTKWPGGKEEDFAANIMKEAGSEKVFKVLAGQTGAELVHSIHSIKHQLGEQNVYFDHIAAPVNDYDKNRGDRISFKETFIGGTGVKDVLVAADVGEDKIKSIEEEYDKIEGQSKDFVKGLVEMVRKDKNLKNLRPSVTFLLGKDNNSNLVVATPVSFLYKYSPSAPAWISDKVNSSKEPEAYISVTPDELLAHIKDQGSVFVVTSEDSEKGIKKLGAPTVTLIENRKLASFAPKNLQENMNQITSFIMSEARRSADENQKAFLDKAKQLYEQTRKATTPTNTKGVNASGKAGTGTGTQQKYSPLIQKQEQTKYIWAPQNPFDQFINKSTGKAPLMMQQNQKSNTSKTTGNKK